MASVSRVFVYTVVILLVLPVIYFATTSIADLFEPFRRGFFCDDKSIQLPYYDSTVPTNELFGLGLAIPALLIVCCEYVHYIKKHELVQFYHSVYRKIICFGSGFAFQYFLVSAGKLTVGRLRPNFIEVCGIDLDKVCQNNTHGYISNFTCPNGEDRADESRVSFPSGHAAFSFYAAVFTVLYIEKRLKFGTLFWKPLIQFCIILLAWWISMTRVMDNQHRLSDVIAGILIGTGVAILNPILVDSLLENTNTDKDLDENLVKNGSSSQEVASEKTSLLRDGKLNDIL